MAGRVGEWTWHPSRFTIPWITSAGKPTFDRLAAESERPAPALVPRTRLQVTAERVTGTERLACIGTLDQIRDDLRALQDLGAQHVVFDWNTGDPEATRNQAWGFRTFAVLADEVLDLERGVVR